MSCDNHLTSCNVMNFLLIYIHIHHHCFFSSSTDGADIVDSSGQKIGMVPIYVWFPCTLVNPNRNFHCPPGMYAVIVLYIVAKCCWC